MTPSQTQHRLPRAAIRSHETTIQGAHPSRCPSRHTSSALGTKTEHAATTDDGPATASGAVDQAPDKHSAQGSGTRVRTGTNTASEPADQLPGTTPSWGLGHLDCARSERDARHPSAHAEQAAAQDLDLWIDGITTGERLALAVSIRWLLTSRSRHLEEGTRTMVDVNFGHQAEPGLQA